MNFQISGNVMNMTNETKIVNKSIKIKPFDWFLLVLYQLSTTFSIIMFFVPLFAPFSIQLTDNCHYLLFHKILVMVNYPLSLSFALPLLNHLTFALILTLCIQCTLFKKSRFFLLKKMNKKYNTFTLDTISHVRYGLD